MTNRSVRVSCFKETLTQSVEIALVSDSKKNLFCLVEIVFSENQLEKDCIGQWSRVSSKIESAMFVLELFLNCNFADTYDTWP